MKLRESTAASCRWFSEVLDDFSECEVLADFSENDYQGTVSVAFLNKDGQCCFIEYSYGSCGGCDQWEDADEGTARREILQGMAVLEKHEFIKFSASHWHLKERIEDLVLRLFN